MKPKLLAVRAVNQYRHRDILAYLGLRFYLNNDCAKTNLWVKDVAAHLVRTRETPIYFQSYHFKEVSANQTDVIHRNIFLPGPNEILAETALLYECSLKQAFQSMPCVYSYKFSEENSKEGIFKSYFPEFQRRNDSIKKVCIELKTANTIVQYTDIKKFYPNITSELALKVWRDTCNSSGLCATLRELGECLLFQHERESVTSHEGKGVLTGPMFGHVIANLVLNKVDRLMFQHMNGHYWRYVDDFVLVGNFREVENGRKRLNSILDDMGFSLHDEHKDFKVESTVWLKSITAIDASKTKLWANLVADIKRFLIVNPEKKSNLEAAFSEAEINIPLVDYSISVAESSYREKFFDWIAKYPWMSSSLQALTVSKIVKDALKLRKSYYQEISSFLEKGNDFEGFLRKDLVSKIRFFASRLVYIADSDMLFFLSSALSSYPELYLQSRILDAIYSRDVSLLIKLGANAVQAGAQVLRIKGDSVTCSLSSFDSVELQGLALLRLNGIQVELQNGAQEKTIVDPLNQFALNINSAKLMKSDNLFVKEIACLRGLDSRLTVQSLLDGAFDRDERMSFDMIDQLQASSYF